MKKIAFLIITAIGISAFAETPADVTVKCEFINSSGTIVENVTIPYGAGEKILSTVNDEKIVVQLLSSEDSPGTFNLRLFLSGPAPIAIAKGIAVSKNKVNGLYIISQPADKKSAFSIYCGI